MEIDINSLNKEELNKLAIKWKSEFDTCEKNKDLSIVEECLNSLRQIKGYHDPEVKFEEDESNIYPLYTRSKVVPLKAKLNQSLLPIKDKNWAIFPTPKPKIDNIKLQEIVNSLITQDENGQPVMPDLKTIEKAIYSYSKEKSANMERVMFDQHIEDKRISKQKRIIQSTIYYGTGIERGPITYDYKENELQQQPDGTFAQIEVTKYRPVSKYIYIWNFFPDMDAVEIEDCKYVYILGSLTKHQLLKLTESEFYFGDTIKEIIKTNKDGNYKTRNWENQMKVMDKEGKPSSVLPTGNYEIIDRDGYVSSEDLVKIGALKEDDEKEYLCNAIICDSKVIKFIIYPIFENLSELYHLFYYEKDETSIFGTGLPKILRDRQLALNAGESNLLGHGAWLKKPCGEVNLSKLTVKSAQNADKFRPGYFLATNDYEGKGNAINFYFMQDNTGSLIRILEYMKIQGDLESSLPSTLFGLASPSLDETAKAFSGRMANLIDFIKDIVRNFDEGNVSYLNSQYKWNMKYYPDDNIKGDMLIYAVGSVAALTKSILLENIGFVLQSLPPEMKERTKFHEFTKSIYEVLFDNPDQYLMSEDEFEKTKAPVVQKQMELEEFQKELEKIKAELDLAKAEKMKAGAEKIRAEIPIKAEKEIIQTEKTKSETLKNVLENRRQMIENNV